MKALLLSITSLHNRVLWFVANGSATTAHFSGLVIYFTFEVLTDRYLCTILGTFIRLIVMCSRTNGTCS